MKLIMHSAALRRWWPLAVVTVLLGLAAVAAAHSSPRFSRVEPPIDAAPALPSYDEPIRSAPPSFAPREMARAEPTEVPGWVAKAALGVCLALVAVVIGLLVWNLLRAALRRRGGTMPPEEEGAAPTRAADEVVAALDAGLLELSDADGDPRRAVIACWVRLEQAAAAAGTPRQVGDTPTDLVTRLLRGHDISGVVLARFAEVYREARYATHPVDEGTRGQARSALQRLRAELTAGVAA